MKKIDILNYITDFRKAPNAKKSLDEIAGHLNASGDGRLEALLGELKQLGTIREISENGVRYFQVVTK